ncbi:MAG: phenylalanine--tRNA ligase subunit beta [Pseudomonadota bacterium]
MKLSENWLREWVNPDTNTQELGERLTMAGLELDGIEAAAPELSGVIVARIESVESHPDAKKLNVCQVNAGNNEVRQIVCGAPNARPGLTVALATENALLPGGLKIEAAELRGVQSFGMLCSAEELGLDDESDGIIELDESLEVGIDLAIALKLDDSIYDIDLTPNRSDCLSVHGIAREVAALYQTALTGPDLIPCPAESDQIFPVEVLATQACPRYCGRVITGVNSKASTPSWMKEYLRRGGIRSISIIVDICNYVMLELGQPMHAFDLNKLKDKIVVRMAQPEESLKLLDGKEIALSNEHLVIADSDKVLALAGIMGGDESAVQLDTADIFLESAYFDFISIAGKARQFGLHTESSHRFERGVDPALAGLAIERASNLIKKFAGGKISVVNESLHQENLPAKQPITLPVDSVYKLLGIEIQTSTIITMFEGLGCKVEQPTDDQLDVTPPSYRFDLEIKEDLIEEITRLHGYDKFPMQMLNAQTLPPTGKSRSDAIYDARQSFIALGYNEAVTFSFTGLQHCGYFSDAEPKMLANPISASLSHMRTSLWPGLCMSASYNLKRQQNCASLFEVGRKYINTPTGLDQIEVLAGIVVGDLHPRQWGCEPKAADFYDVKGHLQKFFESRGISRQLTYKASEHIGLHPGKTAEILFEEKKMGVLGVIHPKTAKLLDLANREIVVFELNLEPAWLASARTEFQQWSKFPQVHRDLTFIVDKNVAVQRILDEIYSLQISELRDIKVFSLYQGKGVPEDLKSISLGLILQDFSSTLTDQNVEKIITNIISLLGKKFEAQLRSA